MAQNKRIDFTGSPGICAASPRSLNKISTSKNGITIKWAERLVFIRRLEIKVPDQQEEILYDTASPQHLLALDLVGEFPNTFEIEQNLRFVNPQLGLVWTEDLNNDIVVPWPMLISPSSPRRWAKAHNMWINLLDGYKSKSFGILSEESLLSAWCEFIESNLDSGKFKRKKKHPFDIFSMPMPFSTHLAAFGSEHMGFSEKLNNQIRKYHDSLDWDYHFQILARKSSVPLSEINIDALAFVPSLGEPVEFIGNSLT